MLYPSPSLIEPLVLLILDETLAVLEGSPWDIDSLAGVGVNEDAGLIKRGGVVYWNNVEELTKNVRVELFVPEDSFKSHSFSSLGGSLEPEGVVLVPLDLEQLIFAHLAGPQADLFSFLVPDKVRLAADDFKFVLAKAYLFNHPELSEVIVIGSRADNAGLVVIVGAVGLDLEGQISLLADNLIDVSPGELKCLHRIFVNFIKYLNYWSDLQFHFSDVTQLKQEKVSRGLQQVNQGLVLVKITVTLLNPQSKQKEVPLYCSGPIPVFSKSQLKHVWVILITLLLVTDIIKAECRIDHIILNFHSTILLEIKQKIIAYKTILHSSPS